MITTRSTDSFTLFQSEKSQFQDFLKKVKKSKYSRFDLSSFFLTEEGDVYVRGYNWCGELGLGDKQSRLASQDHFMPTKIEGLPPIKTFSIGHSSSFLIDQNDKIYAFGDNRDGQLGLGHSKDVYSPTLIKYLDDLSIVRIECWTNTCFLNRTGEVYFCGKFDLRQDSIKSPQKMSDLPPICKIISDSIFDLFLSTEGEVFRRGNNTTTGTIYSDTEMTKLPYKNVKDIAKNHQPVILTHDGKIYLGESDKPLDIPSVERMKYGHYHGNFNIFELKNGDIVIENNRYDRLGLNNERYGIDNNLELPFENKQYEASSQIAQKCKQILDDYKKENDPIQVNDNRINHPRFSQISHVKSIAMMGLIAAPLVIGVVSGAVDYDDIFKLKP